MYILLNLLACMSKQGSLINVNESDPFYGHLGTLCWKWFSVMGGKFDNKSRWVKAEHQYNIIYIGLNTGKLSRPKELSCNTKVFYIMFNKIMDKSINMEKTSIPFISISVFFSMKLIWKTSAQSHNLWYIYIFKRL